jgi:copper homeostasis protein
VNDTLNTIADFNQTISPVALEICIDEAGMAVSAQSAGADRLELCAALNTGGLTPAYGMIASVLESVAIPSHVLIRPRPGDFCYSTDEFYQILSDIDAVRSLGAAGIVAGVLTPDGTVDIPRTRELVERCRPLSFTFHRAFDFTSDPQQALEDIISTGADRILTSGQQSSAFAGMELLRLLIRQANERIIVMPGAGIGPDNVYELLLHTGAREIHLSAWKWADGLMRYRPDTLSLGRDKEYSVRVTDTDKIRQTRQRSRI